MKAEKMYHPTECAKRAVTSHMCGVKAHLILRTAMKDSEKKGLRRLGGRRSSHDLHHHPTNLVSAQSEVDKSLSLVFLLLLSLLLLLLSLLFLGASYSPTPVVNLVPFLSGLGNWIVQLPKEEMTFSCPIV